MGEKLVTAVGLASTQRVLKEIDPHLSQAMDKEIRGSVNAVRAVARAKAPSRTGALRRGIVTRKGAARRRGSVAWQIRSMSRQGGILEFAQVGHTPRGRSLVATLTARYGSPGRFVWEAWDETKAGVYAGMAETMRTAQRVIQTRLDRAR